MADKLSEVYSAYDMTVLQVCRGRESNLLKTDKGIRQLKRFNQSERRLESERCFKNELYEEGFTLIDRCVVNSFEELITYDRYGNAYVMREFVDGKEISLTNPRDVELAVDNLANLHIKGRQVFLNSEPDVHIRQTTGFKKRNQELKRVHSFIMKKHQKKVFEEKYLRAFGYFYEQAKQLESEFDYTLEHQMESHTGYCHGMYNQHSVLLYTEDDTEKVFTTSFDKFHIGNQLEDLYHFMRKAVEKNNYCFDVAKSILNRYADICPLSEADMDYIYILYAYPEKFYKVSNQYINTAKNWISPKMMEKLNKIIDDEERKQKILVKLKHI